MNLIQPINASTTLKKEKTINKKHTIITPSKNDILKAMTRHKKKRKERKSHGDRTEQLIEVEIKEKRIRERK